LIERYQLTVDSRQLTINNQTSSIQLTAFKIINRKRQYAFVVFQSTINNRQSTIQDPTSCAPEGG